MAVSEDGEVAGSVSGGCVEGAVVAERSPCSPVACRSCALSAIPTTRLSRRADVCGTVHLLVEPSTGDERS